MFSRFIQEEINVTMKVEVARKTANQIYLYRATDYHLLIGERGPSEETYGPINKWAFPLNKAHQSLYTT